MVVELFRVLLHFCARWRTRFRLRRVKEEIKKNKNGNGMEQQPGFPFQQR